MKIEILGTGCAKCKKLMEITKETVADLGINAEIVKVGGVKKTNSEAEEINSS